VNKLGPTDTSSEDRAKLIGVSKVVFVTVGRCRQLEKVFNPSIIVSMRPWILALALALIGCGKFSDRSAPGNQNEYVWLTRYDVKTLDPAAVQDWTTGKVLSYLYPSIGDLCDVLTEDNKFFQLKIKKATFTNGDPVTQEDIRFTLERCLCSKTLSTVGNQFASQIRGSKEFVEGKEKYVTGLEANSDTLIKIFLDKPDKAFAEKLKNSSFGVLNHNLVEMRKPLEKYTIGDGAGNWTLDSVAPGREWKLKRKDSGEILKFIFSGDSANRRNQFDTGSADYAMFAAHEIGVVKGHKSLTKGGPTTLVYLQFNSKTKPAL
jgi:ABC-type transport system substrate-binding protein